jgi:CRP/FNR family transcriptional regulator, cyclic AMP receptor protein
LSRAARSKFVSLIESSKRCLYSIFGEMALIDNAPRSATAVAVSDAKLVSVSEKQFLFLISNTPYFALNVMRVMARRLRTANTSL